MISVSKISFPFIIWFPVFVFPYTGDWKLYCRIEQMELNFRTVFTNRNERATSKRISENKPLRIDSFKVKNLIGKSSSCSCFLGIENALVFE